jgi:hypothetical protein
LSWWKIIQLAFPKACWNMHRPTASWRLWAGQSGTCFLIYLIFKADFRSIYLFSTYKIKSNLFWHRRNPLNIEIWVNLVVGSIKMSATISYARRTHLAHVKGNLTAIRYRDEILRRHLIGVTVIGVQREMFQQDHVRPHNARVNMDFLVNQNINVLS